MISHIDQTISSINQMSDQILLTMFIEDIISHRPDKLT